MPAPLPPAEIVRRLTAWRDMKQSHHKKEIAEHLGMDANAFVEFSQRYDESTLDDHLAEAISALNDDDAFLRRVVEAERAHKTRSAAAKAVGVSWGRFGHLMRRAADRGLDGSTPEPAPPGQVIAGISTLRSKNPETGEWEDRLQWAKTKVDKTGPQAQLEALAEGLKAQIPCAPAVPCAREQVNEKLFSQIVISDAHIGALAVPEETGNTWKISEAERVICGCYADLLRRIPPSAEIGVVFLGDTQDYDGLTSETTYSGHVLDSDSRFYQMVAATVRVQRFALREALKVAPRVWFLDADSNHEPASATIRREMWAMHYESDDRIEVVKTPRPYYARTWGINMLGYHHGDLSPGTALPGVFAAEYPSEWSVAGVKTHRHIHHGHRHKRSKIPAGEGQGAEVIEHPTLAGRNAYAARNAMRSLRRAMAHTYHWELGEVGTVTTSPDAIGHGFDEALRVTA